MPHLAPGLPGAAFYSDGQFNQEGTMVGFQSLKVIGTLTLTLFLLGCAAKKTTLRVTVPAEIDVKGIQRIAVLDFRGPEHSGIAAASLLTSRLWESHFYTLVERNELQKILREHAINMSGIVDVTTAVEAGKLLGVDALLIGDVVTYQVEDAREKRKVKKKVWTGDYERDAKGNIIYEKTLFGGKVKKKKYKEVFVTEEVLTRRATVTLNFRLVDVKTARIRAARQVSHSFNKSVVIGVGELPSRGEILNQLLQQCVEDITHMLVPHEELVTVQFESGTEVLDRGIELARNGLWDKALQVWEEAVARQSGDPRVWYNMGVAYEALQQLDKAEKAFDRAVSLKTKKLYIQALKRVRRRQKELQKLREQMRERTVQ